MKYVKRFFITVLVLLILAAGSVFVLLTFYKKELATLLIDTLKDQYGLQLKVDDIRVSLFSNWPHASVELKDVSVSNVNDKKSVPLVIAESISLSFNLEKLMRKEFIVKNISLRNAEIKLVKNDDGTANFKFNKDEADSLSIAASELPIDTGNTQAQISFEVNKISLKNTQFNYIHTGRGQNIDVKFKDNDIRLIHYTDGIKARIRGELFTDGLLFNAKRGEFLDDTELDVNLLLTYFKETKSICLEPSSRVEIKKHRYNICSLIKVQEKKLALIIESQNIKFREVSRLLAPRITKVLSNFDVNSPLNAKVILVVNIGIKEDPILIVDVDGKDNDLTIGNSKIPYSGVSFKGRIISLEKSHQRGEIEKARVIFDPVNGKVYDFPFTASVTVTNLTQPFIDLRTTLHIDAKKIKTGISQDFILNGSAVADISYNGPTEKLNHNEFLDKPMKLKALLKINKLSYQETDRPYVYVVNGNANLNNRDLQFENLHLHTDVGDAVLKGKAENFVNYVLGYTHGFKAQLAARTESLNLNPILIAAKKEKEERGPARQSEKTGKSQAKNGKLNTKMKQSRFDFNVNLFAKKLQIRNVQASNAHADLHYRNNFLTIKSIVVNACDGRIVAKGTIEDFNKINADINVQNVNVKTMFEQFENFGQQAITSENLRGNIFVDAKFKTDLDENMEVKGETMYGDVKLKLKDGHLINFEPVQNLSNFLFRNRDFNDVTFSELNETFRVRGYTMEIQELEIGSNILNLYVVNGIYNFKGNSNVNILIPWSNLKKRGKNYIPKNSGESAENTKGVKLNFSGPNKNMKISFGHKQL